MIAEVEKQFPETKGKIKLLDGLSEDAGGLSITFEVVLCTTQQYSDDLNKKFIAEAGYDPAFGARPLKRAVMRYVEDPVSEFIISDRILQDRHKKGSSELRVLKVGLTPDKEGTQVTLKED